MAMTQEQERQFDKWLAKLAEKKGKNLVCPVCLNDDPKKQRYGDVIMPKAVVAGAQAGPASSGALAQLFCMECGHCILFDCQVIGVKA